MTTEEVIALALEIGFSHAGELNPAALRFRPEVRETCETNRCGRYGSCWTCPPGCGTPEELQARLASYRRGIIVQTTALLEDAFDAETMLDAGTRHGERLRALLPQLRTAFPKCLPMGAGGCGLCKQCTYPDAPCRHPDLAFPSMEAYGLMVADVCRESGIDYYYGKLTLTYSACILLE